MYVSYISGYPLISSADDVERRIGRRLLNTTTPAPVVAVEEKSFFEKVEEFYDDKNNFAMYLVLPCIVLVYGGCSAIYCCYKCKQLCTKKKEKEKNSDNESGDESNDVISQNNHHDKVSLVTSSPDKHAAKAAASNHFRPTSKASVSDVHVGVTTPLPWAIPEEQQTEIKKLPPSYSGQSDFSPNKKHIQQLHPTELQDLQQSVPHNSNAYQMQTMHHPMDYHDNHRDQRRRKLSKEESLDDLDDYDLSTNNHPRSSPRRHPDPPRSRRNSKQNDCYSSDDEKREGRERNENRRDKQRREITMSARSKNRCGYSPTNPRDRPNREETMSGRSDRRKGSADRREYGGRPPRKVNEVKPTPQIRPEDEIYKENSPKIPPPRPAQPPKRQPYNQQDDRFMSPPPPYEGHERKGPARPNYNPNPTIRVISQTKGGGPVSEIDVARQAAEMLRIDDPKFGHMGGNKKPKRLVFVAE